MYQVRVALLGKNALIREGLRHILTERSFEVVHSVEEADKLMNIVGGETDESFMIVVDQGALACSSEMIRELQTRFPDARIALLVDMFDFDNMVCAFDAGIHGYIVKDTRCDVLVGSLELVAMGEKVLPGELAERLPNSNVAARPAQPVDGEISEKLSQREIEILNCLVIGYPNKLISRRLDISEATVKVHVKAILRKLNVHNRTQAAIRALSHGIDGGAVRGVERHAVATEALFRPQPLLAAGV